MGAVKRARRFRASGGDARVARRHMRHLTATAALVVLAAIVSPGARAQDKPPAAKLDEMRKRLEAAREALLKKQQELQGRGGAGGGSGGKKATGGTAVTGAGGSGGRAEKKDAKGGSGGKPSVATTKAADALAELDRTREERRRATVARLRERWGPLLDNTAAQDELRQHAERVARLARIRMLAEEKKNLALLERVDTLVTREELRHGKAMNALRGTGGTP